MEGNLVLHHLSISDLGAPQTVIASHGILNAVFVPVSLQCAVKENKLMSVFEYPRSLATFSTFRPQRLLDLPHTQTLGERYSKSVHGQHKAIMAPDTQKEQGS
jgi:hypothetical protein